MPCPHSRRSGQARPGDAWQHAYRPQTTNEVHRAGHPQPRPQTRAEATHGSDSLTQDAMHIHRIQPQLPENPAVHMLIVQTGHESHPGDTPRLCSLYRPRLILDQILDPQIPATRGHSGAYEARPGILPSFRALAQYRLAAVGNVAGRV